MSTPVVQIPCLVCQHPLSLRLARGRKSGKTFLMVICPQDGRHFRGFINDRAFLDGVLARLEGHTQASTGDVDLDTYPRPSSPSEVNQDRGSQS